jgi:carbon starvation protein CstA
MLVSHPCGKSLVIMIQVVVTVVVMVTTTTATTTISTRHHVMVRLLQERSPEDRQPILSIVIFVVVRAVFVQCLRRFVNEPGGRSRACIQRVRL